MDQLHKYINKRSVTNLYIIKDVLCIEIKMAAILFWGCAHGAPRLKLFNKC